MRDNGVRIVAPPTWALVKLDSSGRIVPSDYARAAKRLGFDIITWTLERSGTLTDGGGYYFQSMTSTTKGPGDYYRLLDTLARKVGIIGIFSDLAGNRDLLCQLHGLEIAILNPVQAIEPFFPARSKFIFDDTHFDLYSDFDKGAATAAPLMFAEAVFAKGIADSIFAPYQLRGLHLSS